MPLRVEVIEAANEYIDTEHRQHKYSDSEYLLLTERSSKMDRDAVNKLLNKYGKALDIHMCQRRFVFDRIAG